MEGRRMQNLTGPHSRYARREDQAQLASATAFATNALWDVTLASVGTWNFPEQGQEQVTEQDGVMDG